MNPAVLGMMLLQAVGFDPFALRDAQHLGEKVAAHIRALLAPETAAPSSAAGAGDEIAEWLHGLERGLAKTIHELASPVEAAQLRERRGIYLGIADDIRRKWPALFTSVEGGK